MPNRNSSSRNNGNTLVVGSLCGPIKFRTWDGKHMEYFTDLYWFEENMVHEVDNSDKTNYQITQSPSGLLHGCV